MRIEQGIMQLLLASPALAGIVGDRIHYVKAPEDTVAPYLVINKISGPRDHTHDGGSGLANPRIQFSAFSFQYADCKAIIEALQDLMQGFSGVMGEVEVNGWFFDNETDNYEKDTDLYQVTADYIGWHRE
jgi:hypothetical protein